MSDRAFVQAIGTVSIAPQRKAAMGKTVVEFSLAEQLGYSVPGTNTFPPSRFLNCSVWDEVLGAAVMNDLYKGAKIGIQGTIKDRQYEGKTFHDVYVYRVWVLEALAHSEAPKREAKEDEWA